MARENARRDETATRREGGTTAGASSIRRVRNLSPRRRQTTSGSFVPSSRPYVFARRYRLLSFRRFDSRGGDEDFSPRRRPTRLLRGDGVGGRGGAPCPRSPPPAHEIADALLAASMRSARISSNRVILLRSSARTSPASGASGVLHLRRGATSGGRAVSAARSPADPSPGGASAHGRGLLGGLAGGGTHEGGEVRGGLERRILEPVMNLAGARATTFEARGREVLLRAS